MIVNQLHPQIASHYRIPDGREYPTIYNILNTDAKRWWYHRQLRDQGNDKEARKRERQTIRQDIQKLRSALAYPYSYCTTWESRNKHGFYHDKHAHTSGYDSLAEGDPLCCRILGILTVNLEPLDEHQVVLDILGYEGYEIAVAHIRSGAIAYNVPPSVTERLRSEKEWL